jgi:hypothetical protein
MAVYQHTSYPIWKFYKVMQPRPRGEVVLEILCLSSYIQTFEMKGIFLGDNGQDIGFEELFSIGNGNFLQKRPQNRVFSYRNLMN